MASSELEQVEVNSQKHDPAWKHCQMYKNNNDDKVQLKCIYCGKFFKGGGIHRIKEHLAGQKGNASSCLRVRPDVRLLMQDSLNCVVVKKKKKQKLAQDITCFNNVNEYGLNNVNEDVVMVPVPVNQSVEIEASVSHSKRRKRGGRVRKGSGSSALVVADNDVFDDDDDTNRVNVNVNNQVSLAIGRFLFDAG
ncbi:putative hAT transposon superfamily protein, partial [Tanacetum coccineum]